MLLRLFIVFLLIGWPPSLADAVVMRTIEVQLSFDASAIPDKVVRGYRLYQDASEVCVTYDAAASSLVCDVPADEGTHIYELSVHYTDGTESPKSPPFEFAVSPTTPQPDSPPPPAGTGAYRISSSWENIPPDNSLAGYRMYMNDTPLCETADPQATHLSCSADLVTSIMHFSMASYDDHGVESVKSNFLTLDPADFPELFSKKRLTFSWNYADAVSSAGGFQVFSNGKLLCQTTDADARSLTCSLAQLEPQHSFAIAAVSTTGIVTTFSNSIVYTTTSPSTDPPPGDDELKAVANVSTTSGLAPLPVSFDASTSTSTNKITAYSWDFGDGDTATGITANHTYAMPGEYAATLRITDEHGASAIATIPVTVKQNPAPLPPPTAILSSSSTTGQAPLDVTFDGSSSVAANGSIISHEWDFGDGSKGVGDKPRHTFASAGTFTATLTVTDSAGKTDTESTPIIVSPPPPANIPPSASFSTLPSQGGAPLTISFDGSASSDQDGTITSYSWSFGDGHTGTGKTAHHTYTAATSYLVSLQVTDDKGARSAPLARTITVEEEKPENILNYEIGELVLGSDWVRVPFTNTFAKPALFVSPPTQNGSQPVLTRIRNLDSTGFEIRLQEWNYLDDRHVDETVYFLALEQGTTTLPGGIVLEVGSFTGKARKQAVSFSQQFHAPPVVLTSIISLYDKDAVTGRVVEVTPSGFSHVLQEQESTQSRHADENVVYLALSAGEVSVDNLVITAAVSPTLVSSTPKTVALPQSVPASPFFFAEQQTMNGKDTAALRLLHFEQKGATLYLQEEQSKDQEVRHTFEQIGTLVISPGQ